MKPIPPVTNMWGLVLELDMQGPILLMFLRGNEGFRRVGCVEMECGCCCSLRESALVNSESALIYSNAIVTLYKTKITND